MLKLLLQLCHPWTRIPVSVAKLINNPAANWLYTSEPNEGTGQRRIPITRGKLLGGSSSINGMVFVRGQSQDYDTSAQLGNRGWSYREVLRGHGELSGQSGRRVSWSQRAADGNGKH
jgi:choline dehydrogenase-like flavoprotein